MTEYFLARHVYFCCRGDALVFLDLRKNCYLLATADEAAALRRLLFSKRQEEFDCCDAFNEFLDTKLFTADRDAGKAVAPTAIEPPTNLLVDQEDTIRPSMNIGHIARFIVACVIASARLRWNRLENTARFVERRKARRVPAQQSGIQKARELTAIFHALRSFFPFDYVCLYDSLALIEFLARYQIFPTWVFGIKLEPWAAHCWVQDAGFIFNEGLEEASGYTPIMAI